MTATATTTAKKPRAAAKKAAPKSPPKSYEKRDDTTQRQMYIPNKPVYDDIKSLKLAIDRQQEAPMSLHDVILTAIRVGVTVMNRDLAEALAMLPAETTEE